MKKERDLELKLKQQIDFMSKGSRQIIRCKSTKVLSQNGSQQSFLQRNFYKSKDKRADSRFEEKSNMTARVQNQSKKDLYKFNDYIRDISGSKISFLNQTSRNQDNGKVLFSP